MRKPIVGGEMIAVSVPLTKHQLSYLKELGYFLRATPEELLVALSFGAIESNADNDEAGSGYMRDLLNWVDERRVPEIVADPFTIADSGQFTDQARKERRAAVDGVQGQG